MCCCLRRSLRLSLPGACRHARSGGFLAFFSFPKDCSWIMSKTPRILLGPGLSDVPVLPSAGGFCAQEAARYIQGSAGFLQRVLSSCDMKGHLKGAGNT